MSSNWTAERCDTPDPRPGHTRTCHSLKGHPGQHWIRDNQDNIVFTFDPTPPPTHQPQQSKDSTS